MDYAPVSMGYWNCGFEDFVAGIKSNGTELEGRTTGPSVDSTVVKQLSLLGGQSRCPTCRCFLSSLKEVSRSHLFNPLFPTYGMCYRCRARCCAVRPQLRGVSTAMMMATAFVSGRRVVLLAHCSRRLLARLRGAGRTATERTISRSAFVGSSGARFIGTAAPMPAASCTSQVRSWRQ
jgi:hypothetical protein